MIISKPIALVSTVVIALGWSAQSLAGCSPPQLIGKWETAFSDGNSCLIKLNNNGSVDTAISICYDPSQGTAKLDSGQLKVKGNCFAEGEIVISGISIELPVQFSHDRSIAAGRYLNTADGSKGSVVMVRTP